MEQHLSFFHPEYAHPGKLMGRPLPRQVFNLLYVTPLEEKKAGVPPHPMFTLIVEKENHHGEPEASTGQKRKGTGSKVLPAAGGSFSGAKCSCV